VQLLKIMDDWTAQLDSGGQVDVVYTRAFQFGQKKFPFDSRYRINFFDSIRQFDKFAALH